LVPQSFETGQDQDANCDKHPHQGIASSSIWAWTQADHGFLTQSVAKIRSSVHHNCSHPVQPSHFNADPITCQESSHLHFKLLLRVSVTVYAAFSTSTTL
jgi:hypothetical protein